MPVRIMTCFGTRPEGIKMMPVIRALRAHPELEQLVCVTGQHQQMLAQVFEMFGETADINLSVMEPGQTLAGLTARVVQGVAGAIEREKPDMLLVHGDTTTAFAAAVAGFYGRIPIGHVEAGLRSFDLDRPWPEEFNRVAVDAIAQLMFAPTESAAANLAREYNQRGQVLVTGNTGIDSLLYIAGRIEAEPALHERLAARYPYLDSARRLILVTGHRRESFGDGFQRICDGLAQIARRGDVQVVYPVHLNPNVQQVVTERLRDVPNIHLIPPVEYADMVYLMRRAAVIVTDSGGIQEEGPALGKPVLVMRDVTERPEALATGVVKLIGTDPGLMQAEVAALLDDPAEYARRAVPVFPYGDGQAAGRIVEAIARYFSV